MGEEGGRERAGGTDRGVGWKREALLADEGLTGVVEG